MNWTIFNKVKANDHSTTDHEGPEGEHMYSSTSVLDGGGY